MTQADRVTSAVTLIIALAITINLAFCWEDQYMQCIMSADKIKTRHHEAKPKGTLSVFTKTTLSSPTFKQDTNTLITRIHLIVEIFNRVVHGTKSSN